MLADCFGGGKKEGYNCFRLSFIKIMSDFFGQMWPHIRKNKLRSYLRCCTKMLSKRKTGLSRKEVGDGWLNS